MNSKRAVRKYLSAAAVIVATLAVDLSTGGVLLHRMDIVTDAQARVGRPATPGSVAGVARRTTRRVVRRSTIYVAALPSGCVVTTVNGLRMWRCGGTYYQSYSGRYVVVYID